MTNKIPMHAKHENGAMSEIGVLLIEYQCH
jgi:hypothetical protein